LKLERQLNRTRAVNLLNPRLEKYLSNSCEPKNICYVDVSWSLTNREAVSNINASAPEAPMMRSALAVGLFLFLACSVTVRGQSTNGSISGRVIDPSHAVIADAKVTAVNIGTNFRYETATNSSGEYYLTNLPPGSYNLEVEKSGFKNLLRPDVILHVRDALAIDFEMTLGPSKESVTVEAGAP
jgi:hypothetical protein